MSWTPPRQPASSKSCLPTLSWRQTIRPRLRLAPARRPSNWLSKPGPSPPIGACSLATKSHSTLAVPVLRLDSLPRGLSGIWSLWSIELRAPDFARRSILPLFVDDGGRTFILTARRIWDVLIEDAPEPAGQVVGADARTAWEQARA